MIQDVKPGDKMLVAGSLIGKMRHIPVTVVSVEKCRNCDGGLLFKTDPPVGSGEGISGFWFAGRQNSGGE